VVPEFPQLAILGLSGDSQENSDAVRKLREFSPECKIVAIVERADIFDLNQLLNCGIDSILFNVASAEALLKVFDLVLLGQHVIIFDRGQIIESNHQVANIGHELSPSSAPQGGNGDTDFSSGAEGAPSMNGGVPDGIESASVQLSNRERQILACVARGDANKLIARSCSITEATVKAHLKAILRKISVRNRTQAALWAIDHSVTVRRNPVTHKNGESNGALIPDDNATFADR
jgi:two-component system nitrate/nitrite response regulator NarL